MNNAEAKMPRISHKLKAQLNMHSMMIPALIFAIVFPPNTVFSVFTI